MPCHTGRVTIHLHCNILYRILNWIWPEVHNTSIAWDRCHESPFYCLNCLLALRNRGLGMAQYYLGTIDIHRDTMTFCRLCCVVYPESITLNSSTVICLRFGHLSKATCSPHRVWGPKWRILSSYRSFSFVMSISCARASFHVLWTINTVSDPCKFEFSMTCASGTRKLATPP